MQLEQLYHLARGSEMGEPLKPSHSYAGACRVQPASSEPVDCALPPPRAHPWSLTNIARKITIYEHALPRP
eukprot:1747955-Pyramimonas_sp.AAC.1